MPDDDHERVQRTLEGDSSAFDHLVEKYMNRAYRIAYRMTGDPDEVEDLTQEAFLKAYQALHRFRTESSFFTWFCRILVHVCMDHLRKKRFRSRFRHLFQKPHDDEAEKSIETDVADPHWSSNPGAALEQTEWSALIQAALLRLPLRQRAIFVLKHFQGRRIHEIARILGISEGTVKTHLFRAVHTLRRELREAWEDTGP